jgi:ankyrin repeat protein/serine/threonine protein kinase
MAEVCRLILNEEDFNLDEIDGSAALFHAAKEDLPDVVKRLHSKGLDLDTKDNEDKTAVFYANQNRSLHALCALIECNADVDLNEIDGKAAFFHAAKKDYADVVFELVSQGLDLNITDDEGKTAVFYANQNHNMNILCELITCDAKFNLDEIDGKAALFHAAKEDNPVVVDRLNSNGLDLNITDEEGKTAVFYANQNHNMHVLCELIYCHAKCNLDEIDGKAALFHAAKENYVGLVCNLKSRGLDLNITDDEGKTAVFYANKNHKMDVLCHLINCDAKFNLDEIDGKAALFHAAKEKYANVVFNLKSQGLDLNITDDEGKTAVFYANQNHKIEVLCRLINCDAKFNLDEIDGKAALFHAAKEDYADVVFELESQGLDLNITDDEGKTAVFYANQNHKIEVLCRLINCGAKFNLDEIDGKAALFHAAKEDYADVVFELESQGLDLNITDDEGKTAVFYANQNHKIEVLCRLINCGAKFNLDEIDGKAALFHAAKEDYANVVFKLKSQGLDLNITDDEGKTAVFYANQNHCLDVLCELIYCDAKCNLDEIDGKAALFHAAKEGYADVVSELEYQGLDLNITDDEGKTAVFYANQNHNMDALCCLISCDAKCNLDEIDGKAALFHAGKNNLGNIVEFLHSEGLDLDITDDEGKNAVFHANQNNNMYALRDLINCDAEANLDEIDGKAALFYAAKNNYAGVVSHLKSQGFDLNITDDEGKTAVFYANNNHDKDVLCYLIMWNAKFNLDEIDGKAALFHSAKNNRRRVVAHLESQGQDLGIIDDEGKTAVFYANQNCSLHSLCELIECDAKFNLDEIDGKAALFHAAKMGMQHVVKPLYNAGLDLNVTDNEGKTVVFYCNKDFLDAMIAVGEVLVNARDAYGRTPLFYALQDDDTTKARHLIEKGGNLQLTDNCHLSIFSFFIEYCIFKNIEALQLFTSELFQKEHQLKALTLATLEIVYCQAPLLPVNGSPHLLKSYAIFNKTNLLKALAFARKQCSIQDADNADNVDKIASMIRENEIDVPLILSLLNKLGANPNAADSDGNTALHYASLLPFLGVTQQSVIEICEKLNKCGALFDTKNQQRQSPLLFCLSSFTWKEITEDNAWQSSIGGLVDVCRFLLSNGSSTTNGSGNVESIFHRIILLLQQGLQLNEEASRKPIFEVLIKVLKLLSPKEEDVRNAVNNIDAQLNSPLHLWASIELKSPQDYASLTTGEHTFEGFLRIILEHLVECGAKLNPRNKNEQTPLHLCRTWTAVKLLLEVEANASDVDSSGHSPLLVAAKDKNSIQKADCLYADITEDAETFWKRALERGLDPWIADKQGESLLSVFIKSEGFVLARALLKVACNENYATNDAKLSLLNVISKDESKHTHWKTNLVAVILESAKMPPRLSLDSALHFCCRNIVKFGMFDEKEDSTHQKAQDEQSDDDGQPPPKKGRKDESIKQQKEKQEPNEKHVSYDSVHWKIAKQFISYGGELCLEIAKGYRPLKYFLKNPEEFDTLGDSIPWNSISDKYKGKLREVAKRPKYRLVDQICNCNDVIGSGSFGDIFAGINEKDGREVAVKCIKKSRMPRPQDRREIETLTALADCEQVVRYISFLEDKEYSYIVLELMEGNLEEYLHGSKMDDTQATLLCKDVVMGLEFLHGQNILHRDLKPANILYKVRPKTCLKIADFGLSHNIDSASTTVYGTVAGTRCWIAPEVLTSKPNSVDKDRFARASDMFSCGLLLHYILSGQKHPFSPPDYASKNALQVCAETDGNMIKGTMEGWDESLPPEATHLVKRLLESNEKHRPSAEEALEHPLFWSKEKKVYFLKAVGNQEEFECPRLKRTLPLTLVETDLDTNFGIIVKNGSWSSSMYINTHGIHKEMIKGNGRKKYATSSAVELVRFIRNAYEHFRDKTFGKKLFNNFVFFDDFPDLVMEVYKAVTTHGWDKTRDDVKFAMNKK